MKVLHLNTHASGGSYECTALLSTALAEQGIESRVLCKGSQLPESVGVLLDRVIRRSYVSFSTEPWHGTRRLLSPPPSEHLRGVDVVHLHTVADWFDVPHWLDEIAGRSPITKACGGVQVIPPGIDTTLFKPQDKTLCRKHLGLPADAFVIVTGGASLNDANKNVPWLFEQLSRLPDLDRIIV